MTFDFARFDHPLLANGMVTVLGDPHLGRSFVHNTPIHRRGDREALVWAQFERSLNTCITPLHVCMGDLFHRPIVSPSVVLRAANAYLHAAGRGANFVILAGNHDISRDRDIVSSFRLFEEIVSGRGVDIPVVREEPLHLGPYLFVPWSPFHSSAEMVAPYLDISFDIVFGHWDVVNPATDVNLVPDMPNAKLIVTGHDHLRRRVSDRLWVTGSMQPYAHGEDWTGTLYQTVTLEEIPEDTHDLCLRVIGDELPDIDALQLSLHQPRKEEDALEEISLDGFDMRDTWREMFDEFGVSARLRDELFDQFQQGASC